MSQDTDAEYGANYIENARREVRALVSSQGSANAALEVLFLEVLGLILIGDMTGALQSLSRARLLVREAAPIQAWTRAASDGQSPLNAHPDAKALKQHGRDGG